MARSRPLARAPRHDGMRAIDRPAAHALDARRAGDHLAPHRPAGSSEWTCCPTGFSRIASRRRWRSTRGSWVTTSSSCSRRCPRSRRCGSTGRTRASMGDVEPAGQYGGTMPRTWLLPTVRDERRTPITFELEVTHRWTQSAWLDVAPELAPAGAMPPWDRAQSLAQRARRMVRAHRALASRPDVPGRLLLGPPQARVSLVRDPGADRFVLSGLRARPAGPGARVDGGRTSCSRRASPWRRSSRSTSRHEFFGLPPPHPRLARGAGRRAGRRR